MAEQVTFTSYCNGAIIEAGLSWKAACASLHEYTHDMPLNPTTLRGLCLNICAMEDTWPMHIELVAAGNVLGILPSNCHDT